MSCVQPPSDLRMLTHVSTIIPPPPRFSSSVPRFLSSSICNTFSSSLSMNREQKVVHTLIRLGYSTKATRNLYTFRSFVRIHPKTQSARGKFLSFLPCREFRSRSIFFPPGRFVQVAPLRRNSRGHAKN